MAHEKVYAQTLGRKLTAVTKLRCGPGDPRGNDQTVKGKYRQNRDQTPRQFFGECSFTYEKRLSMRTGPCLDRHLYGPLSF